MKNLKGPKKIHILGAVIIDIIAQRTKFTKGTSNPAEFQVELGGVGFNIYKGLSDIPKLFHTIIGDDYLTPFIEKILTEENAHYKLVKGLGNGIYMAFMEGGELLLSAIDSRTIESGFDPIFLQEIFNKIKPHDLIIFDANLPPNIIPQLVENAKKIGCELFFETVSVEKTARSKKVISNIDLITPTQEELLALIPSLRKESVFAFMDENKINNIILTEGKKGLTHYQVIPDRSLIHYSPNQVLEIRNSNGAGDFFLSSLIKHLYIDKNYPKAIRGAMATTEYYLKELNNLS